MLALSTICEPTWRYERDPPPFSADSTSPARCLCNRHDIVICVRHIMSSHFTLTAESRGWRDHVYSGYSVWVWLRRHTIRDATGMIKYSWNAWYEISNAPANTIISFYSRSWACCEYCIRLDDLRNSNMLCSLLDVFHSLLFSHVAYFQCVVRHGNPLAFFRPVW